MSKNTRTTKRVEKMNGVNFMCVIRHCVCCFFQVFGLFLVLVELWQKFRIIVKDNASDCFYTFFFLLVLSLREFFQQFFFVIGLRTLCAASKSFALILSYPVPFACLCSNGCVYGLLLLLLFFLTFSVLVHVCVHTVMCCHSVTIETNKKNI